MTQVKYALIAFILAPVSWITSSHSLLDRNFQPIQSDTLLIDTISKIQTNLCKEPPPYCPQTVSSNQNIITSLNPQGIEPPPNQSKPIQIKEPPPSQTT